MRHSTTIATLLVALIPLWVGCTSEDHLVESQGSDEDEGVTVQESYGALIASHSHDRSGDAGDMMLQAQVVEARGVRAAPAIRALDVWLPPQDIEVGECQFEEPQRPDVSVEGAASLRLLDVGDIEVTTPSQQIYLAPTRLPDLLASFHGVIYDRGFSADDLAYEPDQRWQMWAPGAESTGPMDATMRTPEPMVLTGANGVAIADAQRRALIDDDQDLELVWSNLSEDDQVFIELHTGQGLRATSVVCHSEDSGAFSVPASKIRDLARHGDRVEMRIRRVRSGDIAIDGVERAEYFFSVEDALEFGWR